MADRITSPPTLTDLLQTAREYSRNELPDIEPVKMILTYDNGESIVLLFGNGHRKQPDGHAEDFTSVTRNGHRYRDFTPTQAKVVRLLWEADAAGKPCLGGAFILEQVGSTANRLRDIFRGSDAWGTLIVEGDRRNTWRLSEI